MSVVDPGLLELAEAELTPIQLRTMQLRWEGLSYRGIAEKEDVDMTTVRDRVKAAERKLKRAAREEAA